MAPSTSLDSSSALSESITSHSTNTKTSSSESHVTITETTTTTTTSRDFSSSIESTQNSFSNPSMIMTEKPKLFKTFDHMHRGGKHFVRCIICHKFPELVKMFSKKTQVPKICQDLGAQYRTVTIDEHLKQDYHNECLKAFKISKMSVPEVAKSTTFGQMVIKSKEKLANRIGSLMIHVYGDAKKLTLSAHTYPMRVITGELSSSFKFNHTNEENNFDTYDFQYLTPATHKDLLKTIVTSYRKQFSLKLMKDVLTISLRCDGSVDRSQIDKIYVLIKVIDKTGKEDQFFLGAGLVSKRGAQGILDAIEVASINTIGAEATDYVFKNISSIVTDGASVNTGERGGLWTLFKQKYRSLDENSIPLITIWCAAHRSNLAWKDTSNSVSEVQHLVLTLTGLSTFFHTSALRSRELENIAKVNDCKLLRIPKFFQVRWTEFSFSLVNSVLVSWHALVLFFQTSKEKESKGFLKFLTNIDNLRLLCFLADTLLIFSRYQQKIQSDFITILDLTKETEFVVKRLRTLCTNNLLGGWVNSLESQLKENKLKGIQLTGADTPKKRRTQHHLFVTDSRNVTSVCNELVESLANFLLDRIDINDELVQVLKPFISLGSLTQDQLKKVHKLIGRDLDLSNFVLEYEEIQEVSNIENLRKMSMASFVQHLSKSGSFNTILTIFSRVLAAKPHSADVERLISTSNILKSADRQNLLVESENEYLFVHFNMPPLSLWDPRDAVLSWTNETSRRVKETPKAREQSWFKGVFAEASQTQGVKRDLQDIENNTAEKHSKNRLF